MTDWHHPLLSRAVCIAVCHTCKKPILSEEESVFAVVERRSRQAEAVHGLSVPRDAGADPG